MKFFQSWIQIWMKDRKRKKTIKK